MSIRVTNIQRMCFDDGPGIRTTVFLKGCSIHCPWCSNPETISPRKQKTSGGMEYGMDYEPGELTDILEKDRKFWGGDGGVTFSGGEALLQGRQLLEVWKYLKETGVGLAVETALFVPEELLETALPYMDFYYVDVKLLDAALCASVLGGHVGRYLQNVQRLAAEGKDVHFRVPCSVEYVLRDPNRKLLLDFFGAYRQYPIELFPLHHLAESKYRSLGLETPDFEQAGRPLLERFREELLSLGCAAEIISI